MVTRDLLLNLINKKELWCFSYQYDIWLFRWTKNRLRGDVPYFIWHGIRPSYKHIQLWGVRGYIINGRDKKSNLMTDHIEDILRDMQLLHEFFYTGNHIKTILFTEPIMFGLMNIIIASTQKTITLQVTDSFRKLLKVIFMIKASSTLFHENLILHPIHLVMRQW